MFMLTLYKGKLGNNVRTTKATRRICECCQVHPMDSESNKQSHEHKIRRGRLKLSEGQLQVHVFRRKCENHKMLNHVKKTYTHETSFITFEYVSVVTSSPLEMREKKIINICFRFD